jgi:hypothetical protein
MENINDLYWLSGIIEGEGYLTTNLRQGIHKSRNGGTGSRSYITRIGVGNTDAGMIKKISEIYVSLGVKFYYTLHGNKKYEGAQQYISINVEGYRSCLKILQAIQDKMCISQKKFQVDAMIEYIQYRLLKFQPRGQKGQATARTTEEEFETIDKVFVKRLHDMKTPSILPSTTKRVASTILSW